MDGTIWETPRDGAEASARRRRSGLAWFAGWALAALAAAGVAVALHLRALEAGIAAEGATLHRLISQRADQHDALLTSLGAIVRAPGPLRTDLVVLLADSVQRFYPRVRTIAVVDIGAAPHALFSTNPSDAAAPAPAAVATRLAGEPPGRSLVLPGPPASGLYHMVKRAGEEPVALVLTVNAGQLVEAEPGVAAGTISLAAPDGSPILAPPDTRQGLGLNFTRVLGSQSQPLTLSLRRDLRLAEAIPFGTIGGIAAVLGLLAWLGHRVLAERRRAEAARGRARLSADEARLAQATRVNAMGELASGIAHELAQPIAAILSQSQAGARLAKAEPLDRQAVIQALDANARLAKRAGAILDRLRDYVRPGVPDRRPTSLAALIAHVVALSQTELAGRGVHLVVGPVDPQARVLVEPIAIEQALHNLIRNAADAVDALPPDQRRVEISGTLSGATAEIAVGDRGAGLSPELAARLFEPFRSTKPNGMGLGLALSLRLVEANGGRLSGDNRPGGGALFAITLPTVATDEQREAAE
ncbi:Sensor protein FixL [bacterium YEK0313]|nr:Sensor protein FixL [bacterium YEK0313]